MALKRLPYAFCKGCKSVWEFEGDDLIEGSYGSVYWIYCECRCRIIIDPELAQKMLPVPTETISESVSAKAPQEPEADQLKKAYEALNAFSEHGTQVKAAQAIGISVPTLRKRLQYLPSTVETEA